jgi:hypothetical protein
MPISVLVSENVSRKVGLKIRASTKGKIKTASPAKMRRKMNKNRCAFLEIICGYIVGY